MADVRDFFLRHPPNQPKRDIGLYVAEQGIRIPKIYASLQDAVDSGRPFIMRSDNSVEYDGPAGLVESYIVTPADVTYAKLRLKDGSALIAGTRMNRAEALQSPLGVGAILADHWARNENESELFKTLTTASAQNVILFQYLTRPLNNDFLSNCSYSFWELMEGDNRSIIADAAVADRYHIFSTQSATGNGNYVIYDQGKVAKHGPSVPSKALLDELPETIRFYEKIRNLPQFDPNQLPMLEIQSVGGVNYFLQYHRVRSADPIRSEFNLTRPLEPGEIKASFVHGRTASRGKIYDIKIVLEPPFEKVTFDKPEDPLERDLSGRTTELRLLDYSEKMFYLDTEKGSHITRSDVFGPKLTVVVSTQDLFDETSYRDALKILSQRGPKAQLKLRVRIISDGRQAYLKLLPSPDGLKVTTSRTRKQ